MALSTIFKKIIIESDEVMDKLINELENRDKSNNTPKINIQNKLKRGKDILKKM